jgi:hypothetical protein
MEKGPQMIMKNISFIFLYFFIYTTGINSQSCESKIPVKNSDCWNYHSPSSACCYVENYSNQNYSTNPSKVKCQSILPKGAITGSSYDKEQDSTTFMDCGSYNYFSEFSCGYLGTNPSKNICQLYSTNDSICCHLTEKRMGITYKTSCFSSGGLNKLSYVNSVGDSTFFVSCLHGEFLNFNYVLLLFFVFIFYI